MLAGACTTGIILAFSSGPPLARTGDFGENTCLECHLGNSLNAPGGSLSISGVPANYEPGQTYQIQVTVMRSGQQRWGFELATRAVSNAQQAGTLVSTDANTQISSFNGIQYITHTSGGTFLGSAQGMWTFDWTAPAVPVGTVSFGAAGNAANGNFSNSGDFIYTARVTSEPAQVVDNPITLLFPHLAVGSGYRTVFNLFNAGGSAVIGTLSLTQTDGAPLTVRLGSIQASSTQVNIPPGGTQVITADPINEGDILRVGWAKVESAGGSPEGAETFRQFINGTLVGIVGILSSPPVDVATILVDSNVPQDRLTGYAVANPGNQDLNIRIVLVDSQGIEVQTIRPPALNPLPPGGQYACQFSFRGPE